MKEKNMLNPELKHKMAVMRALTFVESITILEVLHGSKDPVPHKVLADAVLVVQHESLNMQAHLRTLEQLGMIETIREDGNVSYRLNAGMSWGDNISSCHFSR